jgi:hypothetical protein
MQGSISLRVKYSRERTHRRNLFRHVKKERKKSKVAERFAITPKRGKNHKAPKQGGEIQGSLNFSGILTKARGALRKGP